MIMIVRNLQDLLDQFFLEGFTMECLSKSTGISVDLIENFCRRNGKTSEDNEVAKSILYVLGELYLNNVEQKTYLADIVKALNMFYEVPIVAIEKYLGINSEQFQAFINDPQCNEEGIYLTIKLFHLFTTFVRQK